MKITIEFNLNKSEDAQAYLRALKAGALCAALYDIGEHMRGVEKYGKAPLTKEEFWEIVHGHNIDLDELYS